MLKGSTSFSTAPLGCLQKVVGVSSGTSDSLCHLATQKGWGGVAPLVECFSRMNRALGLFHSII